MIVLFAALALMVEEGSPRQRERMQREALGS
jgi:hypothetical protein